MSHCLHTIKKYLTKLFGSIENGYTIEDVKKRTELLQKKQKEC
nr:MAG TPA: hypothetical protein [Microviridae sp.]